MGKLYILLFLIIGLSSCVKKSAEYIDLSKIEQIPAQNTILNEDLLLRYPIQIEKVDSVLIIMDLLSTGYYFHLFSLDGKFIKSFGKNGNGPGEITKSNQFFTNQKTKKISIYSNNQLIYYDIPHILKGEKDYYEIVSIELPTYPIINVIPVENGYFYLGFTDKMRFAIQKENEQPQLYKAYPSEEELNASSEELKAAVMSYGNQLFFSPNKKKIAQASYIGAILETFDLSNHKLSPLGIIPIIVPEYRDMGNGAVAWYQNSIIGFDDISTSNSYLYTLLSSAKGSDLIRGEGEVFAKHITVFDWNTQPLYKISVNEMLMCLTVDEENEQAYAIAYSDDGYSLIRTTWGDKNEPANNQP